MKNKILIINYKAYEEAFLKGLEIASYSGKVSLEKKVSVIVAPPVYSFKRNKIFGKNNSSGS